MINLTYPEILESIKDVLDSSRTESASFLIWYLENYYRLDRDEAIYAVCDNPGDKGIDGIYLNHGNETIDIFQTKIVKNKNKTIGDTHLKEFHGTLSQFKTKRTIESLIKTGAEQVVNLIIRLNLLDFFETYKVRGIFVTNIDLDKNGINFLNHTPHIEFVGKSILESNYISDTRILPKNTTAEFDITGIDIATHHVDKNTFAYIAPIKANELIKLQGISDQTIFAPNVRGKLGNSTVNKEIVASIQDKSIHKKFPLFHNGITIVTGKINATNSKLKISNFFVVNGCQSLTALYDNQKYITNDLCILTKFVQLSDEKLKRTITRYSNNQNGVKPRDFKSNDGIQIRLQNDFHKYYGKEFYFEVKRGEDSKNLPLISNEAIGILIMSFDLKEPWGTHRKYQVFDEKYIKIFGRPEVTSHRMLMLYLLDNIVQSKLKNITSSLIAKYALTRYTILYILRLILECDTTGKLLLVSPENFIKTSNNRKKFMKIMGDIINEVIIDLNGEMKDKGPDFDYKSKFRDEAFVTKLGTDILSSYLKYTGRRNTGTFDIDWNKK